VSTATVVVELRDAQGNPLQEGGRLVEVRSSMGTVGPVVDQRDGTYIALLTAPTRAGTANVRAWVDGERITEVARVIFVTP